jgi:hypothetical protein
MGRRETMDFDIRLTNDLVRIASAGGGMRIDGSKRLTADLVRIASAASISGARVTMTGMGKRLTNDLVAIASAGKGAVSFEE